MHAEDNGIRSISLVNLLLGAWFIVSPFWLNYTSGAARWNQIIVGIIIVVFAVGRMLAPTQRWMSIVSGIAALWAIVAPFILSYNRAAAYWNEVIVGIVVAYLAFMNSSVPTTRGDRTQHHGV